MRWVTLLLVGSAATVAYADPQATTSATPARYSQQAPVPASDPANDPAPPLTRTPSVQPYLVFDPPPPPVKSLRLEALRIAGERAEADWRYPTPEPIFGYGDGMWFMGAAGYHPRTARSAALHGGSIASTILGEVLLGSGSPAAGVGALLTGATLDAAAADVDRDAEARRPGQ
jgi:hypothetical protein